MPNISTIGRDFVQSSFKSKREMDRVIDKMRADLQALNSRTHTGALLAYRSLSDRLVIKPDSLSFEFSMDNLERLSRFIPSFGDITGKYQLKYRDMYESNRISMFQQIRKKEERLQKVLKEMGVNDDRISTTRSAVDLVNAVNAKMYENIAALMEKWKKFVYDTFFIAITQQWTRQRLEERWLDENKQLRIGSSLEGETDAEMMIAATTERTAYLQEQAKKNNYDYCWNVNPMDALTKPECISASMAGVIPEKEMGSVYGFPPRYICRCEIAYTRGEWTEFNSAVNNEIEKSRLRLIEALEDAPRQKSSWEVITPSGKSITVKPTDPERLSGKKMYKDIEEKLAMVEGMTVPEFKYEREVR